MTIAMILSILTLSAPAAPDRPMWLAVAHEDLHDALGPLAKKRRRDGYEPILAPPPVETALRELPRPPACILLVGHDVASAPAKFRVPSPRHEFYRWAHFQDEDYASDMLIGDLDEDGMPDVPVGRIPARSPGELTTATEKTLRYERTPIRPTDLRVLAWGGTPNYGEMYDNLAGTLLQSTLQQSQPQGWGAWLLLGNAKHPLCGKPIDQPGRFTQQLADGATLGILIGHANPHEFISMQLDDREILYTLQELPEQGEPLPPLVFLACHCGNFTLPHRCLGENALFLKGGPVVAIAATTESHPLTNFLTGAAILQALDAHPITVGDLWLDAQSKAHRARNFLMEKVLIDVEGKLEPKMNQAKLRRDQMLMYALLGDPATRMRMPKRLDASLEQAPEGWTWIAQPPSKHARLFVEFRVPLANPNPDRDPTPPEDNAWEAHRHANARFNFVRIEEKPPAISWTGHLNRTGILRLVAADDEGLHMADFKLKVIATQPAP